MQRRDLAPKEFTSERYGRDSAHGYSEPQAPSQSDSLPFPQPVEGVSESLLPAISAKVAEEFKQLTLLLKGKSNSEALFKILNRNKELQEYMHVLAEDEIFTLLQDAVKNTMGAFFDYFIQVIIIKNLSIIERMIELIKRGEEMSSHLGMSIYQRRTKLLRLEYYMLLAKNDKIPSQALEEKELPKEVAMQKRKRPEAPASEEGSAIKRMRTDPIDSDVDFETALSSTTVPPLPYDPNGRIAPVFYDPESKMTIDRQGQAAAFTTYQDEGSLFGPFNLFYSRSDDLELPSLIPSADDTDTFGYF